MDYDYKLRIHQIISPIHFFLLLKINYSGAYYSKLRDIWDEIRYSINKYQLCFSSTFDSNTKIPNTWAKWESDSQLIDKSVRALKKNKPIIDVIIDLILSDRQPEPMNNTHFQLISHNR